MSYMKNDIPEINPTQLEGDSGVQLRRVLLVEDNPGDARLVREILLTETAGIELDTASKLATAIELLKVRPVDVILLDLRLPDSAGLDTLRKILVAAPGTAVVVLTGLDDEDVGDQVVKLGAQSFLVKGEFDGQLLVRTLRHASERQRLISQLVTEISLRCELQQALEISNKDLEKRIAQRTAELRKSNRALSMLSQGNRAMLHARTEGQLLHDICRLVVGQGEYPMAWIGSVNTEVLQLGALAAYAFEEDAYLNTLRESWDTNVHRGDPVDKVVATGKHIVYRNPGRDTTGTHWMLLNNNYGFTGMIAIPLKVQGDIVGILVIYSRSPYAFDDHEVELLLEMTADLSFGINALRTSVIREKERTELIKFSTALKQADDIVIITDKDGVIDYVNPAFERASGFAAEEARGRTPGSLVTVNKDKKGNYSEMWQSLERGEPYRGTFVNHRKDGSVYYEQKTITPIKDDQGNIQYYLSTGKDITDDLQLQERLRNVLNFDALTGLPNRSLFLDRLNQIHEQAQWEQRQFAIIVINIDRFKIINSSLGHKAGDDVLQFIAKRLKENFRPIDVVARLVGNTFAIILSDQTDIEQIIENTRNLLTLISRLGYVDDREIAVSACIGVAIASHEISDPTELLKNAEAAMYEAKQRGPNQIEFYNKAINEYSVNTLTLEIGLRHALERKEFVLFYQPKVELATGRVVGVEALIRWQHPEHGLVSPLTFIPLLEQTGLIVPVGQWVLEEACRQLREWDDAGVTDLQMALNLSPRQFLHDGLVEDFTSFFRNHGLEYITGRLELEITESSFMQDFEHGVMTLQKLKSLGLKIAIDDFGTGYSSLSYLSRLPVDVLKIDRSFIKNYPESTDDIEIVRAIIALAKSLSLPVVAEGVENQAQRDFLLQQGCELAQGYLYSAPQPADKLLHYLRSVENN